MGKGKIAGYEQFLFFPLCFQKTYNADTYKQGLAWERNNAVFSTLFQLYRGGQYLYRCFPGILLTSTAHNILSKQLPHITIAKTMDSGEREMNPVAMTIINPRKEYWQSPGIEPATSGLFSSPVRYRLSYGARLGSFTSFSLNASKNSTISAAVPIYTRSNCDS